MVNRMSGTSHYQPDGAGIVSAFTEIEDTPRFTIARPGYDNHKNLLEAFG